MSEDRRPTTVRLREELRTGLERAGVALQRSQSSIMEESLEDWLKQHNFYKHYQLTVRGDYIVLAEIDDNHFNVKAVQQKNGTPIEQIAREYSERLNVPVKVIREEK
jgi:hypothetical protein